MLSFRLAAEDVTEVDRWAERLGMGRSELIRESLRRYLRWLESADDSERWEDGLPSQEQSAIADWGVAEDWSDWTDDPG